MCKCNKSNENVLILIVFAIVCALIPILFYLDKPEQQHKPIPVLPVKHDLNATECDNGLPGYPVVRTLNNVDVQGCANLNNVI